MVRRLGGIILDCQLFTKALSRTKVLSACKIGEWDKWILIHMTCALL